MGRKLPPKVDKVVAKSRRRAGAVALLRLTNDRKLLCKDLHWITVTVATVLTCYIMKVLVLQCQSNIISPSSLFR